MNGEPPPLASFLPFAGILLAIAVFPLIHRLEGFWEKNRNKLLIALAFAAVTLAWYLAARGVDAAGAALERAILQEYLPFIIFLFALYTISGGIHISGDIPATPAVNCAFLGAGAILASFIGTTGASMLLIRPLLRTNSERRRKVHTVIFFISIVSNIGGCLTPLGDPPLFLGYLRGVPFWWTLKLLPAWLAANGFLLAVYYVWDRVAWARERPEDRTRDATRVRPLGIQGLPNFVLLAGVVAAVALVDPNLPLPGTSWKPFHYLREALLLVLVAASWFGVRGNRENRERNRFSFAAIAEVACLFLGIFIAMQPPIEYLHLRGGALYDQVRSAAPGIPAPAVFFWATGALSSFLDNAPTYMVFFETARAVSSTPAGLPADPLLIAVSLGAVFMGANTYIGNGPNFMVKTIAEHSGIRMPSFFGYMAYSGLLLIPLFAAITAIFLWGR
jgi:Na+/H+ antiporter NhaD/arsenite permease-like protein